MSVDQSGSVVQKDDYSPFGLTFNHYESTPPANQYTYNGKEEQKEWGVIDYEARMYQADLGRWFNIDPLAEKNHLESPFVYVHNNPLKYIDPDGKDGVISITGNTIKVSVNTQVYGSGASNQTISTMKSNIMKEWGARSNGSNWTHTDSNGKVYDVVFDVNISQYDKNDPSKEPGLFSGRNNPFNRDNFIELDNNAKRSFVSGGDEGIWRAKGRNGMSLAQDDSAPHEFGHLLGLDDRYTAAGPYAGWAGDIMAEPAMQGAVSQKNIDGIVGDAVKGLVTLQDQLKSINNLISSGKANQEAIDFLKTVKSGIQKRIKDYKHEIDIDNPSN